MGEPLTLERFSREVLTPMAIRLLDQQADEYMAYRRRFEPSFSILDLKAEHRPVREPRKDYGAS